MVANGNSKHVRSIEKEAKAVAGIYTTPSGEPLNWLEIAVLRAGGVEATARLLNKSTAMVYRYLKTTGVRRLKYFEVERLAEKAGISIRLIGLCGKEEEPPRTGQRSLRAKARPARRRAVYKRKGR